MTRQKVAPRIVFYSHDGFGLGHVRRNLSIAQAVVRQCPAAGILLMCGTSEVCRLRPGQGIAVLKVPSLRKLPDGTYRGRNLDLPQPSLIRLRSALMKSAIKRFQPSVFVADKHPLGVSGELKPVLKCCRRRGVHTVLGLRDILDEPERVRREWRKYNLPKAIRRKYDHVLIYGDPSVYDAAREYGFSDALLERTVYCGYVLNNEPTPEVGADVLPMHLTTDRPLVVGSFGGGEDAMPRLKAFVEACPRSPMAGDSCGRTLGRPTGSACAALAGQAGRHRNCFFCGRPAPLDASSRCARVYGGLQHHGGSPVATSPDHLHAKDGTALRTIDSCRGFCTCRRGAGAAYDLRRCPGIACPHCGHAALFAKGRAATSCRVLCRGGMRSQRIAWLGGILRTDGCVASCWTHVRSVVVTSPAPGSIAYVVKRYPRFSETFIVQEILAHEAAGQPVEIFALRPPDDTHFQDILSHVRAPVHYLRAEGKHKLWEELSTRRHDFPGLERGMTQGLNERSQEVYQSVLLASLVQRRGIHHIHAHFATSAATVARLASIFSGVPYTFTAHAKDIFHESVNPEDLTRKLSDAAFTITVSDYNLAYLREQYGSAAERVVRIYNGVDPGAISFVTGRDGPPVVLAVGRLVEKKGFHILLEACAMLSARGRVFSCRIAGEGEERNRLEKQIKVLGLLGKVELLGPRPQRDVHELLAEATVLAAPCVVGGDGNRDGLPTILLEAMACGTPCVSTDLVGISEAIEHGETGLLVPPDEPAALADALEELLTGRERRNRLAQQARNRVEDRFDRAANSRELRALFAVAADTGAQIDT